MSMTPAQKKTLIEILQLSAEHRKYLIELVQADSVLKPDPEKGLAMLSPVDGFVATSPDVSFAWEDPSNLKAVYDLHVYSDAARTKKVYGTDGVIFDTNGLGTATNHTFANDPSDGAKRYGLLWQWPDSAYTAADRKELLFDYTAFKKEVSTEKTGDHEAVYEKVKALGDSQFAQAQIDYTKRFPMLGRDGYFSAPLMWGCAQAYRASDDEKYFIAGMKSAQLWIDSGKDLNNDGYLDWWDGFEGKFEKSQLFLNYAHHEWRAASGVADMLIELIRSKPTDPRAKQYAQFLSKHVWEKWEVGNKQTSTQSGVTSNINSQGVDFVGRLTIVAVALDIAQKSGLIPVSGRYTQWMADRHGLFYKHYLNKYGTGKYGMAYWIGGDFRGEENGVDTGHATDLMYALFRTMQLGYDTAGKKKEFLEFYLKHLDAAWFPNEKGWTNYVDGYGKQNNWNEGRAHGQALAGSLSPTLMERWIKFVLENKPSWSYHAETGNSKTNSMFLTGCMMWMLRNKIA